MSNIFDLLNTATWTEKAICVEAYADAFFPEKGSDPHSKLTAKMTCLQCPVILECREAGMAEDYGIWGGLTEQERKRIRKERTA